MPKCRINIDHGSDFGTWQLLRVEHRSDIKKVNGMPIASSLERSYHSTALSHLTTILIFVKQIKMLKYYELWYKIYKFTRVTLKQVQQITIRPLIITVEVRCNFSNFSFSYSWANFASPIPAINILHTNECMYPHYFVLRDFVKRVYSMIPYENRNMIYFGRSKVCAFYALSLIYEKFSCESTILF